jgi:hypothetical protein
MFMSAIRLAIAGRLLVCVAIGALLSGCTNLGAVRNFAQSSAAIASYPDAGAAYVESGRQGQLLPPAAPLPSGLKPVTTQERQQQVREALQLQAAVASYFAVMAKLAGADAFALDKDLDRVAKALKGLPGQGPNAGVITAANTLLKLVLQYALAPVQESSVRGLIQEGGPPAMSLVNHLDKVAGDWHAQMTQDDTSMNGFLTLLASTRDAGPGLSFVLKDRAQQFEIAGAARRKRVEAVRAGLQAIRVGHESMVEQLNQLDGKELKARLEQAYDDLKTVRELLETLR